MGAAEDESRPGAACANSSGGATPTKMTPMAAAPRLSSGVSEGITKRLPSAETSNEAHTTRTLPLPKTSDAVDPSVDGQVVERSVVPATAKALRSFAGYQKEFASETQRVVAAVDLELPSGCGDVEGRDIR